MYAELFASAWKAGYAQDKAGKNPGDVMPEHSTFTKAKAISAEACRLLKPVAQRRQRGHTVFPDFAIANGEGEIITLFYVFHEVSFSLAVWSRD
jgi:hypothetical protein